MRTSLHTLRAHKLLASVLLAIALGSAYVHAGLSVLGGRALAQEVTETDQPFYAATDAELRSEGDLSYADRPADVQAVMRKMYANDSRYARLSALFVDHEPLLAPGSIRIAIQQPDTVRTVAYENDEATGIPSEQMIGDGNAAKLYSPKANVYTSITRSISLVTLPPLATLPLSVVEREDGGTTIYGVATGGRSTLADMFIHPAMLITAPFFTNKTVAVLGKTTRAGRTVWELQGTQVPTAPVLSRLGDGWRAWVDTDTGIVLRVEYDRGAMLIGWAELRDVNIDGHGQPPDAATVAVAASSIPSGTQQVDLDAYHRATHD